MTMQLKLLMSGVVLLLLLTILAMVAMERGFDYPMSSGTSAPAADRTRIEPVKTAPHPDSVGKAAQRSVAAPKAQTDTKVSPAQLDLMAKREEARLRRDEMLKMRAETIEKMGPGNTGDQQTVQ